MSKAPNQAPLTVDELSVRMAPFLYDVLVLIAPTVEKAARAYERHLRLLDAMSRSPDPYFEAFIEFMPPDSGFRRAA